jgi:thiamine-monophosphate kinase
MPGEFDFIRRLIARTPPDPRVRVGPGDDCAVLARPPGELLVTTDLLTEGVDFLLAQCGPRAVGRKAMAVNLSDLAAMAGRPLGAVVAVALPPGGLAVAEEIDAGLREVAGRFDCPVVGGDTNAWAGGLVVAVTVFGSPTGRGPVLRSGARPGDWLFVTGPLGGSLLGRHLNPTPRLREAELLHTSVELRSMLDLSDGLARDVGHLAAAGGCGVALDPDRIPIHSDAFRRAEQTGRPPLDHALTDGEDFELVFAVCPADGARLLGRPPVPVWKVGECEAGSGVRRTDGEPVAGGWEHRL